MFVSIHQVTNDGAWLLQSARVPLSTVEEGAAERAILAAELNRSGRVWVGGGASPLFYLALHREG